MSSSFTLGDGDGPRPTPPPSGEPQLPAPCLPVEPGRAGAWTISAQENDQLLFARDWILRGLTAEMEHRQRNGDNWVEAERWAVATAANEWAQRRALLRRVMYNDVEHIEGRAVGHIDYASKLALYVAEYLYGLDGAAAP